MEYITLSRGEQAIVDDEDFDKANAIRWYLHIGRYARNTKVGFMHQFVMGAKGIDHIDFNGLNNQKSNLRLATPLQQLIHNLPRQGCTSQYKGVWRKRNKWQAYIQDIDKRIVLGCYVSEKIAALCYDHHARKIYGEFAVLNFPEENSDGIDFDSLKRETFTSKYKYVNYDKSRNKWTARPTKNNVRLFQVRFDTEEEAYLAVCDALRKEDQI